MIFTGKVISIFDDLDGDRIKVRIKGTDKAYSDSELPFAFPLLPKSLHVKPKVGEAVIVVCVEDNPSLQRFYIGPIISQNQKMLLDFHDAGALKMVDGTADATYDINSSIGALRGTPMKSMVQNPYVLPSTSNIPEAFGAICDDDDITIYGRKNSDIILGDSDVRIRCGARLLNNSKIAFNKSNPSLIKLKYHETPLSVRKKKWIATTGDFENITDSKVESSVNVIGQEINLISTEGSPYVKTFNNDKILKGNESLSDVDLVKFIETAHPMVYGDELLKYLHVIVTAFKNHTHPYTNMVPTHETTMENLDNAEKKADEILSKNIRIN